MIGFMKVVFTHLRFLQRAATIRIAPTRMVQNMLLIDGSISLAQFLDLGVFEQRAVFGGPRSPEQLSSTRCDEELKCEAVRGCPTVRTCCSAPSCAVFLQPIAIAARFAGTVTRLRLTGVGQGGNPRRRRPPESAKLTRLYGTRKR